MRSKADCQYLFPPSCSASFNSRCALEVTPTCMELSRRKLEALRRGSCPFLWRRTRCAPMCGSSHGDTQRFSDWGLGKLTGLQLCTSVAGKGVCTGGDKDVIAQFPLIQEISVESSLADLAGAIPTKMRQQFQYLLTRTPIFLYFQ